MKINLESDFGEDEYTSSYNFEYTVDIDDIDTREEIKEKLKNYLLNNIDDITEDLMSNYK